MSNRPVSAKTRPYSATRTTEVTHTLKTQNGDVISYEDLLVAQYLEELKRSQPLSRNNAKTVPSPYLQKLSGSRPSSSHVIPATKRPQSATVTLHTGQKPKIDPKFIADPDLWDPATPRDYAHTSHRNRSGRYQSAKGRPISAPVYKRPLSSSTYSSSRPGSAKYGTRRTKPLYKRQPYTIVVLAFKNGCRDAFAKIAAPSIKVLLEMATDKLGLPSAGRRVFLDDGTEVFTPHEIYRDSEVYISCGEPFKDPLKPVKKQSTLTQNCAWTMNGLVWTQDTKKKATKSQMSRRFRTLIEQSRRRVLVFKNGQGSNGVEIVADPERLEDFLVGCTAKLELGSYARVLYDWSGHEVHNLEEAPVLDQCLQTWSTPVLGPLWVSKGEGFSPKGVEEFLTGLIKYTKIKLKEAKHYKTQLEYGQSEDTKLQVQIVAILSMTESEIDETIEIVKRDIEDFSNALNRLKEQMEEIKSKISDEVDVGHTYKMKHIQEFDADHPLVGTKGLRLKVYENGTDENETTVYFNLHFATRGVENDRQKIMARFLDECSAMSVLANPKNPQIRPVASKIYDRVGKEIKDVRELKYDQEIWLSYGEPWKNPFTYVLAAQFDKVRVFDVEYKEESTTRRRGGREQLMGEDVEGQDKANKWEICQGLPHEFSDTTFVPAAESMERESVLGLLECAEIPVDRVCLMANKENPNLVLFPELVIDTKQRKGGKNTWPAEAQSFIICQNGFIKSKAMPGLVLAVLDFTVKSTICHPTKGPTITQVEGFMVGFEKKVGHEPNANQCWEFTQDGLIRAQSHADMFLTYLGSQYANEDSMVTNEDGTTQRGQGVYLCVAPRIEGKQIKSQRFALKQERFENLGQWKVTKVENPEWQKRALSWPLNENGDINEDYDWPMEAYIMPYAPPLKKKEIKNTTNAGQVSLRLIVLKNGVRDICKAVPVVGPDLTNMKKDTQIKKKDKKKKDQKEIETEQEEELSVLKLEFVLFLERCTALLDLPFAARRLFDESGKEHFSLVNLQRDQLVYVSCGEIWTDPTLSKAEQQRRFLLSNLASDVAQIRHFVNLRHADNLVLQVVEGLQKGAHLCVDECALNPDLDEQEEREAALFAQRHEQELREKRQMKEEMEALVNEQRTAHDHSHARADERHERLKWPWERIINRELESDEDPDEQHFSNKEFYRKFKPKKKRQDEGVLQLQKFIYDDNRIVCSANFDLVIGISQTKGSRGELVLVKRRPDDIMQCFNIQPNGLIQCKYNPQMVLTVAMPNSLDDQEPGSYVGCEVNIQRRKTAQFGRANQRWYYDESTGMIQAFHTTAMDKEITAANRANVCTFAVMGTTEIDQPGYVVDIQVEKGAKAKRLLVCSSCARAMRGRHKLEKVTDNVDFACSMGSAKEHGVKQMGSFQCLNGKVDLSTNEAHHTLDEWESQLCTLKDELSVRAIAREISAARAPYTVKVLAYKNGEGRLKPAEVIVSSSIPGLLEQASGRLGLTQAARRAYMRDGTLVLDVDDIVDWMRQEYVRDVRKEQRLARRAQREAVEKAKLEQQKIVTGGTLCLYPYEPDNYMQKWAIDQKRGTVNHILYKNLVLDVVGANRQQGAALCAARFKNSTNQLFNFQFLKAPKETTFWIVSRMNNLCLDVTAANRKPGARLQMYARKAVDNHVNQQWYVHEETNTIRTRLNDFCLGISGGSQVRDSLMDKVDLDSSESSGDEAEQVEPDELEDEEPEQSEDDEQEEEKDEEKEKELRAKRKEKILSKHKAELERQGIKSGGTLTVYPYDPQNAMQKWDVDKERGTMNNLLHKNLVLDVAGANKALSASLCAARFQNTTNQLFNFSSVKDKYFWIIGRMNNMCLDVAAANRNPGAKLLMYTRKAVDNHVNQQWYVHEETNTIRTRLNDFCLTLTGGSTPDNLMDPEELERRLDMSDDEGEEMVLGFEILEDRKNMDQFGFTVIIPNPDQPVEDDAYVMSWLFHTNAKGRIMLMIMRRGDKEPNNVQVVSMVTYNAPTVGEHQVDCSDKPMTAKKGDLLGFMCLDEAMIPFDIEPGRNEYPLYTMLEETPREGQVIPMESWMQQGSRQYSLNAFLLPESKVKPKAKPATQRPKSAKREKVPANKRVKRVKKGPSKGPYIEPPPVDMVLKYPIEVWISCGENFVKPEKVETQYEDKAKMREERAQVAYELDKEKHILRQMTGRRYDKLDPGEFKSTSNPYRPVYKQGHWQDATLDELQKHDTVHQLRTHLSEVKATQKRKSGIRTCNVKTTRRLYTQPSMKRVLVFPNGESIERAQYLWGETLEQLLDNTNTRLDLRKPAKYIFTIEGIHVQDIDELERDQLVCAAATKQFMLPKEAQQQIEIKANWGRARKKYGPHATDVIVSAKKNEAIDVDPFGPSVLAGGPTKPQRNTYPSTHKH